MKIKHLRTMQNFSLPGLGNEAIANIVLDLVSTEDLPNTLWVIQRDRNMHKRI